MQNKICISIPFQNMNKYAFICTHMRYMLEYAHRKICHNMQVLNMQKYAGNMQQYAGPNMQEYEEISKKEICNICA